MKLNRRHVLILIFLLSIIVVFIPFKVHYSFESTALVFPIQEWHLKRGQDDSYVSELVNNKTNAISHLKNYKFERGDVAEVNIREDLIAGALAQNTDTIAEIHSFDIDNEITKLRNQKAIEENALIMSQTGEKVELIQQAQRQYDFADQQLNLERKNFERQSSLFKDSIISASEFETAENTFRLAEINVEIAKNELDAIKSGSKIEELNYIQQRIDSYDREISTLEKLQNEFYIIPPISGIVQYSKVSNGIITLSDTTNYILKIPVKLSNIQFLKDITAIRLKIPGYDQEIEASFLDLEESVNLMANQQMAIAKALIPGGQRNIYPGMAVQCKVVCDEITIYQYLKRGIQQSL